MINTFTKQEYVGETPFKQYIFKPGRKAPNIVYASGMRKRTRCSYASQPELVDSAQTACPKVYHAPNPILVGQRERDCICSDNKIGLVDASSSIVRCLIDWCTIIVYTGEHTCGRSRRHCKLGSELALRNATISAAIKRKR